LLPKALSPLCQGAADIRAICTYRADPRWKPIQNVKALAERWEPFELDPVAIGSGIPPANAEVVEWQVECANLLDAGTQRSAASNLHYGAAGGAGVAL